MPIEKLGRDAAMNLQRSEADVSSSGVEIGEEVEENERF